MNSRRDHSNPNAMTTTATTRAEGGEEEGEEDRLHPHRPPGQPLFRRWQDTPRDRPHRFPHRHPHPRRPRHHRQWWEEELLPRLQHHRRLHPLPRHRLHLPRRARKGRMLNKERRQPRRKPSQTGNRKGKHGGKGRGRHPEPGPRSATKPALRIGAGKSRAANCWTRNAKFRFSHIHQSTTTSKRPPHQAVWFPQGGEGGV